MSSTWETTTEVWALRSAVISYRKCVSFKTTTICLCQPFLTPPGFGTLTHPQVVGRQQIPSWLHQVSVVNYWQRRKAFPISDTIPESSSSSARCASTSWGCGPRWYACRWLATVANRTPTSVEPEWRSSHHFCRPANVYAPSSTPYKINRKMPNCKISKRKFKKRTSLYFLDEITNSFELEKNELKIEKVCSEFKSKSEF